MKKLLFNSLLLTQLLFISAAVFAQENKIPSKSIQKSFLSFDALSVDMPTSNLGANEDHMGLIGIHYNLLFDNLYAGLGFYGSVRGRRGGFFTLGVNAGYQINLNERIFLDTGFNFGAGGGAAAPDGGGAFIKPHFNIGHRFDSFNVTGGYSYVNFFDGGLIKSHQLNVAVQIPLDIDYTSIDNMNKSFRTSDLKNSDWNSNAKKVSGMVHLNNLSVVGRSQTGAGESLNGATIRLAGFELNSYLNDNFFWFFKADGAYSGIPAGYMNLFFGGGYSLNFNKNRTNLQAKFGIGAGGGGGVDSQGGVFIYPDISIEQHLFSDIYFSVNKGLMMSPNSFFKANTLGFGIKYYTNINGVKDLNESATSSFKGIEVITKHDVYFKAKRIQRPAQDLHQISLQVNYHLTDLFYLAGQTSFASFGNAGAYAEGLVGAGIQSSYFMNKSMNIFAQGLAGGAGGGAISTGQGLIFKPSVGINYLLNNQLALRVAGGYVKARKGELSSFSANVGLVYRIGFLKSN